MCGSAESLLSQALASRPSGSGPPALPPCGGRPRLVRSGSRPRPVPTRAKAIHGPPRSKRTLFTLHTWHTNRTHGCSRPRAPRRGTTSGQQTGGGRRRAFVACICFKNLHTHLFHTLGTRRVFMLYVPTCDHHRATPSRAARLPQRPNKARRCRSKGFHVEPRSTTVCTSAKPIE